MKKYFFKPGRLTIGVICFALLGFNIFAQSNSDRSRYIVEAPPDSNLPESQRLLLEGALNRLEREANALDGRASSSTRPPPSDSTNLNEDPIDSTDPNPKETLNPAILKERALRELARKKESQRRILAPEEARRLEQSLTGDDELTETLELFLKTPFEIEDPEKHQEFLKVRDKLIDLLFESSDKISNRRHFVVNHYRLYQKDALARFRNFENAFQLRYERHAKKMRNRERFVASVLTYGGAAVGFIIGLKFFKTPIGAESKFPMVAKGMRVFAITTLPLAGYAVGESLSVSLAPWVTRSLWSVKEPFTNDPEKIHGDLSELLLLDRELDE